MSVIGTTDNTVVNTIPVDGSDGVAVTPDGGYVYVANTYSNTVSVIRTTDNMVVNTIPVDVPVGVAVTTEGDYVYVVSGSGAVWIIGF